jgi:hypothetical protein
LFDVASHPLQLLNVLAPDVAGAVSVTDVLLLNVLVNWLDPAP